MDYQRESSKKQPSGRVGRVGRKKRILSTLCFEDCFPHHTMSCELLSPMRNLLQVIPFV